MPFLALAIGAGAGLLKAETTDKSKADRERTLAAATQRYAPWTGLKAQPVQEPDPLGSALSGAATGAQLQGNYQNSQAQTGLLNAQAGWLRGGGSPQYANAVGSGATWGNYGPTANNPWSLGSLPANGTSNWWNS